MSAVGLPPADRAILANIFASYADCIDHVALFGSRATSAARANSDIDLVIYGTLNEPAIDRLWTLCAESALSVSVDLLAYTNDLYPPLRRHIDATARVLFTREDLHAST